MRTFSAGKTYNAVLNGRDRTLTVLEVGIGEYYIRWDDADEEWAYTADMERWTDEWKCKHVFRPLPAEFDPERLLIE